MDDRILYSLYIKKSNWIWHTLYWIFAASLMFFIFSNRNYDLQIRIILVSLLIVVSYFVTLLVNKYLIPNFLFEGKIFIFMYLSFAVFIFTLWVISFSIILIVVHSAFNLPTLIVPQREDIVILIAGNYLIVIMAAVIHFIKESYRRLIEKNDLEKQKQQIELKLKEANLKLLQGQIHPHFLFNMLNNLYGMVKENVDSSREVIVKLSELLDYMLYKGNKPEIKLKTEIDFIENYIELERVRHDENFNVKFTFTKEMDTMKIAPLVLFPFVENAFKHGFHNPPESFILIELKLNAQKLNFEIKNSIANKLDDKYLMQEGRGIGLKNVKDRLELIYKDKYRLDIMHNEDIFKVNLEIDLS